MTGLILEGRSLSVLGDTTLGHFVISERPWKAKYDTIKSRDGMLSTQSMKKVTDDNSLIAQRWYAY